MKLAQPKPSMGQAIKPWSPHRQVLWAVGVFGLIFWGLAVLFTLAVGGFGPGSEIPRASFRDLPVLLLPSAPCIYYIVVAHRVWSRVLGYIGAVMHAIMLILLLVMIVGSGERVLALLPFLIVGPIAWILHARSNGFMRRHDD